MLYKDKFGNLITQEEVEKLPLSKIKELGIDSSDVDDGELFD